MYVGCKREKLEAYVRKCEVCKRYVPMKRTAPIDPIITNRPWERLQMDCIDLRKYVSVNRNYTFIVTIIDCYTKFLFAKPVQHKSGKTIADIIKHIIDIEGAPKEIQTDNGLEFVNLDVALIMQKHSITHVRG